MPDPIDRRKRWRGDGRALLPPARLNPRRQARTVLAAEPVDDAFARSAEAFERAAAALEHAMTVAPSGGELAERLAEQAEALVWIAARFEQSADLARHVASGSPPARLSRA